MRVVTHNDNFPCVGCDESNFHLASTTWSGNFTSNTYKYDNLKTVASSTSYARINVDKTISSTSYFYALFDFSTIPNGATITNTIGKIRLYSSGNYVSNRDIRWCIGDINTPLRTSQNYSTQSNPTAITLEPLQSGISVQDLNNVKCYVRYVRSSRSDTGQRYIYMYGADVTVDWNETLYAISTSSSVQGVGISAQDDEITSGGTDVITLTGVSSLSNIKLMDNDVDVTSSLVRSGSNYTYTLNDVDADHTITVEAGVATYSVNASSTYTGATITANPSTVQEGSNCTLTLVTPYLTKVKVTDNGNDITSQFVGSNGTFTYTLTNVTTAHTIIVSEVVKPLYMNIENVMKAVSSIKRKENGEWVTISMLDFWRKVNGTYANDSTVSGQTSLVYGDIL
jgi:hypothetical protein